MFSTGACLCIISTISFTDVDNPLNSPSFLATAMRLSDASREPTEEQILNDVEHFGFESPVPYDYNQLDEFGSAWSAKDMKPIYVDDFPFDLQLPTKSKRYNEFLGKRQTWNKRIPETPETNTVFKRYVEFLGKRNKEKRPYNTERSYSKRYMEFLGKRATQESDQIARKRYAEFLG